MIFRGYNSEEKIALRFECKNPDCIIISDRIPVKRLEEYLPNWRKLLSKKDSVRCEICGREWVDQEALNLHLKLDHDKDPSQVKRTKTDD